MAPPCYADLGKQARDLFNKSYHFNLVKLDCKTKTSTGMEFTVNGSSNSDTGRVSSSLETKYNYPEYGMTLKEKWNTDNVLQTEISVDNQLIKGLKLAFDATFAPQSGKKTGMFKTAYKMDNVHLNTDIDFDYAGPVVHSAAVLGCSTLCENLGVLIKEDISTPESAKQVNGWLAGAQASFDTGKNKLTRTNFAVGYATKDFTLHTNVNDGQEFGGSVYQKVSPDLETGVQLAWTAGNNATRFGLGCIYSLDENTSLRAKINNSSQIGLGLSHKLRDGIQLTLSAMIDGKNFNQGGHKLGIGLDLEA